MNKPIIYSRSSSMQIKDVNYLIQKYFHHVDWRSDGGDVIMDVGCGTGDITAQILLTKMPPTIDKIVGADISKEMIQYATEKHTDPKLEFKLLDIAIQCLEEDMKERFDHIMSFYCLHWVQDQRHVFQNIYKMLKSGGNLFISYLVTHSLFEIYERLAKKTEWAQYMFDADKYISPFQHSNSPENELKKILEEAGFDVKVCTCESRKFMYKNRECWMDNVTSVNPFIDRLPENLKNDYLEDYINEAKQMNLVEKNNEEQITVQYKLFIICAKKITLN